MIDELNRFAHEKIMQRNGYPLNYCGDLNLTAAVERRVLEKKGELALGMALERVVGERHNVGIPTFLAFFATAEERLMACKKAWEAHTYDGFKNR